MLDVQNISKTYGETRALTDVSIAFEPGTVHAVLGENGSGKSTLVKLLAGTVAPSHGRMVMDGVPLTTARPAAVQAKGIATVFQEVLVAPDRSVIENILLGQDGFLHWSLRGGQRRAAAAAALARLTTAPIDLDAAAQTTSLAVRQLIVLARALAREPRVLILDEITAALSFSDREAVFQTIEAFARAGGLVLFISHRMDEVMRLSHRVSVLRSGQLIDTLPRDRTSPESLLRMMAPETARELAPVA
jgi:ribose transport system ATP-binding protein